jgi:hypothetical protein
LHLAPFLKLGGFNIDEVIEDGTLVGKLNNLPLVLPPVRELLSEVLTVLFGETTTDTPHTSEHKDVFQTFNVLFIHDRFQ